jgi:hypothetical protein
MNRNKKLMKRNNAKKGKFISLMLDAKNLLQKSDEKQKIEANISIEQAKRMQNGSFHASYHFEAKKILSETGSP